MQSYLKVILKYVDGESVIHEISELVTRGVEYIMVLMKLKPVIGGLGLSILTTNHGLITNKKAEELGVGGEVICTVW